MYTDILLSSKKHSLILFSMWGLAGQTNAALENEGRRLAWNTIMHLCLGSGEATCNL